MPSGSERATYVRKKRRSVGVRKGSHGTVEINCYVSCDCLLTLRMCRMGFQDLLKFRLSSLFVLQGCISSSMASLMSRSIYSVLAERSFVSCSLTTWSRLTLYSAADLSVCVGHMCLVCSLILIGIVFRFVQYKPGHTRMECCIHPAF